MLKGITSVVLFTLFFIGAWAQQTTFTISGKIDGQDLAGKKIELKYYNFEKQEYQTFEEKTLSGNGAFTFNLKNSEPTLYRLFFTEKDTRIAVDEARDIKVYFDGNNFATKGSESTTKMNDFPIALAGWDKQYFGQLKIDLKAATEAGDEEKIKAIELEVADSLALFKRDFQNYIDNMGTSVGTYYVLEFWDSNRDKAFTEKIIMKFINKNPDWQISKALAAELARIKGLDIGQPAPQIMVKDAKGLDFNLKDWQGKHVLIDFWASWCQACRVENPRLVKVYQQYHSRGLEVIGITRDEHKDAWQKAIEKDGLPWRQVYEGSIEICELFGVNSLPQNVLLDPEGIIIAKNLNAATLEEILEERFKDK